MEHYIYFRQNCCVLDAIGIHLGELMMSKALELSFHLFRHCSRAMLRRLSGCSVRRAVTIRLCAQAITISPLKNWDDVSGQLNTIHSEFAESRELIGDAKDSVGSTYFADDIQDAIETTERCLARYSALKAAIAAGSKLEGAEAGLEERVKREYDMKFKQLAEELKEVMKFCE